MKTYKYMSITTGEVVENLSDVIRVTISDFKNYHLINLKWKYKKSGF